MSLIDEIRGAGWKARAAASISDIDWPQPTAEVPRVPGRAWVEERTRVAVGREVFVSGRLVFHEPVRVEGRFRGEVSSRDLVVIAAGGSIEGRVRAPRLLVLGELRGDVQGAEGVVLGPRARITGDIETQSLTICEGARLNGNVRKLRGGTGAEQAQPHSA